MKSLPPDFRATALAHLAALYGDATAREVIPRLEALLQNHRASGRATAGCGALALSERDVLLITYGDQVREAGSTPLQTLARFCEDHLRDVVSGVHILPFYPFTSDDGFSVTDCFAVDPELGTWEDVRRLGGSFELMFDAVFNHMSAQSEWFKRFLAGDPAFRDFFVTVEGNPDLSQVVRPRALPLLTGFNGASGPVKVWTTFSADQVDVNAKYPEVFLRLLEALLFYVARGARFIRLDAIAYLWKEIGTPCIHLPQTHRVIQFMRTVLDAVAPHVLLITETNVPHVDNVSYFGDGTNEAQLVYNFALPPLVLHTLATGNAAHLTRWARTLRLPSDRVTFFNFLASHDGIGVNPARGILSPVEIDALVARATAHGGYVSHKHNPDGSKSPYELNVNYFDALSNPAAGEPRGTQVNRFLCAHAIQLALAGVPGIYFHSLFGSRNDRAGAESSGIPRRINRQKLRRAEIGRELADSGSLRAQVFGGLKKLLQVRRRHAAFHPNASQEILAVGDRVFALRRTAIDGSRRMLCLQNVANESVTATVPVSGAWADLLSDASVNSIGGVLSLTLSPYQVAWLESRA
ncbi:MAG TPA: alpha-amylase family glycosyl hydrolase [Verrucomicrobiae bacterium]|jgi:sucrose phosphorylase